MWAASSQTEEFIYSLAFIFSSQAKFWDICKSMHYVVENGWIKFLVKINYENVYLKRDFVEGEMKHHKVFMWLPHVFLCKLMTCKILLFVLHTHILGLFEFSWLWISTVKPPTSKNVTRGTFGYLYTIK